MTHHTPRPSVRDLMAAESAAAVRPLLAANVVFHSPVADYAGRDDVAHLLATIARCMADIVSGHEFIDGSRSVAELSGTVDGHAINGVLVQLADADGRVVELTLLLRPLAALQVAVASMRDLLAIDPLPNRR